MCPHVLLVDDEPAVLRGLQRILSGVSPPYSMHTASGVDEALARMREVDFDAVITDINMPVRDGFALLANVLGSPRTSNIPVIVVTGSADDDLKQRALEMGAVDLLNKPVRPLDLLARLGNAVRLKAYEDRLRDHNAALEHEVAERTAALAQSRLDIIWRLGKAAEHRDEQTGNHVIRVGCYSRVLAEAMGLDSEFVETLFLASPLHDIGKIGIPDRVLRKRGALSDDEWEIMQRHCVIGAEILSDDASALRIYRAWYGRFHGTPTDCGQNPVLKLASSIALAHHEWWNGAGYPSGLAGNEILLAARIVAVADTYDALRSERPYKPALPELQAVETIQSECGNHLDPEICDAFARSLDGFRTIYNQLADMPGPVVAVEYVS